MTKFKDNYKLQVNLMAIGMILVVIFILVISLA